MSKSIQALPGAAWISRYRSPGCEACYQAWAAYYNFDLAKTVLRQPCGDPDPLHGGQWAETLAGGKMLPLPVKRSKSNAGERFYATLRKLGCQKDAGGDYKLLS